MPPDIQPMHMTTGVPRSIDGWAAEPKLDGWRARVLVGDNGIRVRTRRGHDLTASLPTLEKLRDAGLEVVLDGEVVAGAGTLDDFYRLGGALARRTRGPIPVTFAAFDVLWHDGELLTGRSYAERRARLESLGLGSHGLVVVPSFPGEDAADLFRACDGLGVEGLVLKQLAGTYQPGVRSPAWRKVKCRAWREHLERRIPRRG